MNSLHSYLVHSLMLSMSLAIAAGCAETEETTEETRVLLVVSNHGELGDTGQETGVWMAELTHPFWALADSELDLTIDLASPDGGRAPIDAFSVYFNFDDFLANGIADSGDPDNNRFLESAATAQWITAEMEEVENDDGTVEQVTRHWFTNTLSLTEIDHEDYDVIYFAGGNGAMWQFPDSEVVHQVVADMYEAGAIVSAACHGTSSLVNTPLSDGSTLVDGRRVTGFSNLEEQYLGQDQVMPFLLQDAFTDRGAEYVEAEPWQPNVVVDGMLITGQNPPSAAGVGRTLVEMLGATDAQ